MDQLLAPTSITVVGSVSHPSKPGAKTVQHLRDAGFPGELFACSTAADAPACDVAVVALPAVAVGDAIAELDDRVGQFVVYSSGFGEVGSTTLADPRLRRRLLGPNSVGYYSARGRAPVTFAKVFDGITDCAIGPGVALVSHSGAFGVRVVSAARQRGLHIGTFVATGNEDGWDVPEVIRGLVQSPRHRPRVLVLYLEGARDGVRLMSALSAARDHDVRVVALVGGRSERAAEAARSHTAAVTPDHEVFVEVLRSYQVRVVDSDRALVEGAIALATTASLPHRPRLGILSGSGGAGVVLTDLLDGVGARMPELSVDLCARLASLLPAFASTQNPVDVTASVIGNPDLMSRCRSEMIESGELDCLVTIGRIDHAEVGDHSGIPSIAALLDGDTATLAPLIERGASVVGDLQGAATAVGLLAQPYPSFVRRTLPPVSEALDEISDAATSLDIVRAAGVEVAPWRFVHDTEEARRAGDELGWPVVLKANVTAGTHKRAAGAVVVGVTADDVAEHMQHLSTLGHGVIVARQFARSTEFFVGVRHDPMFGVVVSVGLGGSDVELIRRVVSVPGDLSADMIDRRLDDSVLPGDRNATERSLLADAAVALADHLSRTGLHTIECNPLVRIADRLVALDARALPRRHDQ
jgi:acyl-CoA synthetase (NDP forming)